ncbi:hypothetical protein CJ030_MR5G017276 [Morella rubra]|uniref:Uncharacterized protein n=1 Tax=Morella rubra TaxID=262757 RepID=A0A6A1VMS7_9ROSI|nr:hypothetical protein CJ030_MR5G017276 [Morella rubra]
MAFHQALASIKWPGTRSYGVGLGSSHEVNEDGHVVQIMSQAVTFSSKDQAEFELQDEAVTVMVNFIVPRRTGVQLAGLEEMAFHQALASIKWPGTRSYGVGLGSSHEVNEDGHVVQIMSQAVTFSSKDQDIPCILGYLTNIWRKNIVYQLKRQIDVPPPSSKCP